MQRERGRGGRARRERRSRGRARARARASGRRASEKIGENSLRRCPVLPVWAEPAAWQKRTETRQQDVRTVLKKQVQKQPAAAGGKSGQQPGPENLLRTKAAEKQRQRQRQRDTQRDKTTPNPQLHLVLPPPQPAGQQEHPALHLNVVVYQYVRSCAGDRKRRYVLETRARAGYY